MTSNSGGDGFVADELREGDGPSSAPAAAQASTRVGQRSAGGGVNLEPRLGTHEGGRDDLDVVRRFGRDDGATGAGLRAEGLSDEVPGGDADGEVVGLGVATEGAERVEGDADPEELVVPLSPGQRGPAYSHGPMVAVKVSDGSVRDVETEPGWQPSAEKPVPTMRCTHVDILTGVLCQDWSLRGLDRCRRHADTGGFRTAEDYAEAVVHGARNRIMGMSDDAVATLADLMANSRRDQVRLAAATAVLDRAGIRPGSEVKVEAVVEVGRSPAEIVAERMARLAAHPSSPDS